MRPRQPFAHAFDRWLETRQLKVRTREGYMQAASYALRFFDGSTIAEITPLAAQDFLAYLGGQPTLKRAQSIRWAWYPFRATLDLAVRQGAHQQPSPHGRATDTRPCWRAPV